MNIPGCSGFSSGFFMHLHDVPFNPVIGIIRVVALGFIAGSHRCCTLGGRLPAFEGSSIMGVGVSRGVHGREESAKF
jgi:hypothetical protein